MGLGSDAATGWPMTDWIEDFLLRSRATRSTTSGSRIILFDHPDVVEVVFVVDLVVSGRLWRYGERRGRPVR